MASSDVYGVPRAGVGLINFLGKFNEINLEMRILRLVGQSGKKLTGLQRIKLTIFIIPT